MAADDLLKALGGVLELLLDGPVQRLLPAMPSPTLVPYLGCIGELMDVPALFLRSLVSTPLADRRLTVLYLLRDDRVGLGSAGKVSAWCLHHHCCT